MNRSAKSRVQRILLLGALLIGAGCQPEVGSPEWCALMKDKPKGDWTANEASDYVRHCLID